MREHSQAFEADCLDQTPFTGAASKPRALGNGVPLPLGRAIARAVLEGLG